MSDQTPTEHSIDPEITAQADEILDRVVDESIAGVAERVTAVPDPEPPVRHVAGWVLPVIAVLIVALVVCTNVGNAVWASWVNTNPLGLLALNSSIRYLVATSINTALWPFTLIATLRLLAPDPLFYLLGFLYRERALRWGRRVYPGVDKLFDQFEEDHTMVKTILYPLLVIAPNNPICLLAGVAAFPWRRFVVLNVVGTVGRVLLFRWIGFLFEDQIRDLLNLVSDYQRWLTIGSIVLVVAYVVYQVVGNRGVIGNVDEMSEDLED